MSSSSHPSPDGSPADPDGTAPDGTSVGRGPAAAEDAPGGYPALGAEPVDGVRILRAPAVPTVVVQAADVPMATIAGLFDAVFGKLFPAAFEQGLTPAGPAFALYTRLTDGPDAAADVEIGFPLDGPLIEQLDDDAVEIDGMRLVASVIPAGEVAVTSHLGGFDGLGRAWGEFFGEIGAMGRAPGNPFWESYVTEPSPDMDPADLRTDLYCLVRTPDNAA